MTRVLLISGKGGVGKTSVAAATGLACARDGKKTLVLSFDFAHSLSDAFDLEERVFSRDLGSSIAVEENLDIEEIDLQEEIGRQWGDLYQLMGSLFYSGGSMQGVVASEVDLMPGMEDLLALNLLRERYAQGSYDVIVVDLPPTAEALGFVGFTSILEWYVRKRLPFDRRIARLVRPVAVSLDASMAMFLPEDYQFDVMKEIAERVASIDKVLHDPEVTSIRLVTNPEKMVILETKRALMYFSLHGMTVDSLIVNRVLPEQAEYYAARSVRQRQCMDQVCSDFHPLKIFTAPWMPREVAGPAALAEFAVAIYGDRQPHKVFSSVRPYSIEKESQNAYRLEVALPFVEKDQIELRRSGQDLSVRLGSFRRSMVLPRVVAALPESTASFDAERLVIRFFKNAEPDAGRVAR